MTNSPEVRRKRIRRRRKYKDKTYGIVVTPHPHEDFVLPNKIYRRSGNVTPPKFDHIQHSGV
jgi:hypothetical protein